MCDFNFNFLAPWFPQSLNTERIAQSFFPVLHLAMVSESYTDPLWAVAVAAALAVTVAVAVAAGVTATVALVVAVAVTLVVLVAVGVTVTVAVAW